MKRCGQTTRFDKINLNECSPCKRTYFTSRKSMFSIVINNNTIKFTGLGLRSNNSFNIEVNGYLLNPKILQESTVENQEKNLKYKLNIIVGMLRKLDHIKFKGN